jgi:hypothetical protein
MNSYPNPRSPHRTETLKVIKREKKSLQARALGSLARRNSGSGAQRRHALKEHRPRRSCCCSGSPEKSHWQRAPLLSRSTAVCSPVGARTRRREGQKGASMLRPHRLVSSPAARVVVVAWERLGCRWKRQRRESGGRACRRRRAVGRSERAGEASLPLPPDHREEREGVGGEWWLGLGLEGWQFSGPFYTYREGHATVG